MNEKDITMLDHFTRHPRSVGETYVEHLGMAAGFAATLLAAALVCAVHAVLPFLFEKTGSRMIADLYQRTGPGRIKMTRAAGAPETGQRAGL